MARKRTKPVAEDIEEQQSSAQPESQATEALPVPDVFDQAIADRHAGSFEQDLPADVSPYPSASSTESPPLAESAPHIDTSGHDHSEASVHVRSEPPVGGFTSRVELQPDPFAEYRISLTRENEGSAVRLYRNRYLNLAAIRFDEKPSAPIRTRLQQGGFSWRQQDRVWVKPLGSRPGEEHRRVRELFEELADQIRAENGMPPIRKAGLAV